MFVYLLLFIGFSFLFHFRMDHDHVTLPLVCYLVRAACVFTIRVLHFSVTSQYLFSFVTFDQPTFLEIYVRPSDLDFVG